MSKQSILRALPLLALVVAILFTGFTPAWSDENKKKREHFEESEDHESGSRKWFVFKSKNSLGMVENATYKKECGACHFAYQPALLPAGSWKKLLGGLEDHFGDNAVLDEATRKEIAEYLTRNAAEFTDSKRAYKILRSLNGKEPLRITDIPYIKKEHHEVSRRTLERLKITGLTNCNVCHKKAEQGLFGD